RRVIAPRPPPSPPSTAVKRGVPSDLVRSRPPPSKEDRWRFSDLVRSFSHLLVVFRSGGDFQIWFRS
ncbi:hypothetical protein U1Q18_016904, partial [Sarracenia purpurea var. burkii]